ncbi:hypothetical protein NB16F96_50130 [Escherichia coli]
MPAWPGKAEPAATSFVLCPGTGRKKAGIFPISANLRVEPSEECDASVPR